MNPKGALSQGSAPFRLRSTSCAAKQADKPEKAFETGMNKINTDESKHDDQP
jgi:hypothetical protein